MTILSPEPRVRRTQPRGAAVTVRGRLKTRGAA